MLALIESIAFSIMSLEEKHDTTPQNKLNADSSHPNRSLCNLGLETGGNQAKGFGEKQSCNSREHQSSSVSPSKLDVNNDYRAQSEELTMKKKLSMLQDVFRTVSGDLEDIKTLMLRLRGILNDECLSDNSEEQRPCSSGESGRKVIVMDDEGDDDDVMKESMQLLRNRTNFDAAPASESSLHNLGDVKYSSLVSDIEVLKSKLVALKRNLAE